MPQGSPLELLALILFPFMVDRLLQGLLPA